MENKLPACCLLRHHPVFCGMLRFTVCRTIQDADIRLSNAWAILITVAHPYNAVKQNKYIQTTWTDMETFMSIHKPENVFVGAPSTQDKDHATHLALATGLSITTFVKSSRGRKKNPRASVKGARALCIESPLLEVFRDRYVHWDQPERPGHTSKTVENILGEVMKRKSVRLDLHLAETPSRKKETNKRKTRVNVLSSMASACSFDRAILYGGWQLRRLIVP